ncbi:histidine kinase [Bacillus sp. JJ1521]|uniref:sensor histidine kinase n=1 Tax=Bacillus sp. JJ1521 TaxID=3122957 RepID=UPI002FFDF4EB
MKWRYRLSFYQRIQLSLIFLVILPILLISVISYIIIKKEVTESVTLSNQQLVNIISSDLTKTIDDITFSTVLVANDTSMQERVNKLKEVKEIDTFDIHQNIEEISDFLSLLESKMIGTQSKIFFVNPFNFIINGSEYGKRDKIQDEWEILRNRVDIFNTRTIQSLGTIYNKEQGANDYFFGRVLREKRSNEYIGTLIIRIPNTYFSSVFNSIEMGKITLLSSNNEAISSNQMDSFTEGNIVKTTKTISRANWTLVSEISQKEITGTITNVFFLFFVLMVILVLGFFLLSIFMSKQLIKPIKSFEKIVNRFVKGDHSVRFRVKGKDEISIIGNAFNDMLDQIKELIQKIEQEQEEKKIIELQTLFAQIRPHFLMNTLNSIKVNLAIGGDEFHSKKMDSLISLLRSYMRVNVPNSLLKEFQLIHDYLDIMNMRNGTDIEARIKIEEQIEEFTVPRLLIQPLIENSIIHGFIDREPGAVIDIHAYETEDDIQISISDNGKGMTEEEYNKVKALIEMRSDEISSSESVGLVNIAQRLKLTYGQAAFLHATRNEDKGMIFTLHIPKV